VRRPSLIKLSCEHLLGKVTFVLKLHIECMTANGSNMILETLNASQVIRIGKRTFTSCLGFIME
jgi:hypothetical protein